MSLAESLGPNFTARPDRTWAHRVSGTRRTWSLWCGSRDDHRRPRAPLGCASFGTGHTDRHWHSGESQVFAM